MYGQKRTVYVIEIKLNRSQISHKYHQYTKMHPVKTSVLIFFVKGEQSM